MFYPKCECGGTVESAEQDRFEQTSRHTKGWLFREALVGHHHPYAKMALGAVSLGRAIYKRVPGGGLKRCTNCGNEFR